MIYISISSQFFFYSRQIPGNFDRDEHMSTFMFVEQRGQDGNSGRTAVLHPDQHPL